MHVGLGFSVAQGVIGEGLGRPYTDEESRAFREWLAGLVRSRAAFVLGVEGEVGRPV